MRKKEECLENGKKIYEHNWGFANLQYLQQHAQIQNKKST